MNKDPWKDYLTRALPKAGMNQSQVQAVLGKYQSLAARVDKKLAFESVLESYGNEDTAKAVSGGMIVGDKRRFEIGFSSD